MRKKKLFAFCFLFSALPLILDFKVPEDFSWLKEFLPLYETVTVDHWEKDPKITFDENGWVQVSKQSNPVTLSQYALVCFDTYRSTGDVKYKKAFLSQVKYLMSDKVYKEIAKDRISYPYSFAFHDLKPDWYSGLAQAEAICVLIRYYVLTRDDKALPLIIKLKNHMLWPMEDGGLLAKTPEGGLWIEEYPNSKQNKHVLNGFLISIFGLYEYTKLFPDDKEAKDTYDKCLLSLKTSVSNYDTGNWLQYDRGNKTGVSNWYMKAQVVEMKMLYNITNDPYFLRLHMMWSTFAYNKPLSLIGCRVNDKNFSVPLKAVQDGWLKPSIDYTSIVSVADIKTINSGVFFPNRGAKLLFDKASGFFQPMRNDTASDDPYVEMIFKSVIKADRISITNLADSTSDYTIDIEYKSDSLLNWKGISVKKTFKMGNDTYYQFNEIETVGLKLKIRMRKNSIVRIGELNVQNSKKTNDAIFAHYQTDVLPMDRNTMKFDFESRDVTSYTVFYKYGNNKAEIARAKWNANDYTNKVPVITESCGPFYQYLVVIKLDSPNASIRNIAAK